MSSIVLNGIKFWDPKNGSTGKWSIQGGREYTVTVLALTPSVTVGPQQIMSAMNVGLGSGYSWPICSPTVDWDYGSFLQSVQCVPDAKDSLHWTITMQFTPYNAMHEGGATESLQPYGKVNPMLMPPQVTWSSNKIERSWPFDYTTSGPPEYSPNPLPYVNAAGDPLEDPPKTEDSNPVITIVRNEQYYDPNVVAVYKNHTNLLPWLVAGTLPGMDDLFSGYAPNTMKCGEIAAKRVYDSDWGVYWEVTYEFEYRDITWQTQVLNAGTRCLGKTSPPGSKLIQCVDQTGAAVSNPVCLAKDGTFNANSPPTPNYLTFQAYPMVDFTPLNIPWQIFVSGPTA